MVGCYHGPGLQDITYLKYCLPPPQIRSHRTKGFSAASGSSTFTLFPHSRLMTFPVPQKLYQSKHRAWNGSAFGIVNGDVTFSRVCLSHAGTDVYSSHIHGCRVIRVLLCDSHSSSSTDGNFIACGNGSEFISIKDGKPDTLPFIYQLTCWIRKSSERLHLRF